MAKNDDVTTRFKIDITDFKKGITEANNQIKLANSQFKAASNGTKEWEHSMDGVQAKIKQTKDVLQAQNDKLKAYKNELATAQKYEQEAKDKTTQLKDALEKAKKEYGENSDEVKKLEKELEDAQAEEEKMKNQVQSLTVTMNNQQGTVNRTEASLNGLENELTELENAENKAGDATEDLSKDLKDVDDEASKTDGFTVFKGMMADLASTVIQTAIEALKDFASEIINVGREFDAQMSKVQAISGASGKDFDDLRNKAKEMGASTKFTAKESAQAFEYMAMAGWKPKEMLQGIKGIMDLAAASGEDLASTSDIVTDGLTALGMGAKDAGHFSDVLAVASSNSNTNVSLLGETFKYAASVAGSYGYKLEDVAWASGLMANAGIKGTQAGTALRSIMSRLATDAGASSKQLGALGILTKKLGVEFYDSNGKMRDFKDVMEDARVAFKKQSSEDQAFIAKKIAGQNAMSGFLTIMNATTKDSDKLSNALKKCDGSAEDMAKTMNDNLNGDMTTLGSTIEGLQQNLYDKFSPALRVITQGFTNFVRSISDFTKGGNSKAFDDIKKGLEDMKPLLDFLKDMIEAQLQIAINNTINSLKIVWQMIKNLFSVAGSFFKTVSTTIKNTLGILGDILSGDFSGAWERIKTIFSSWSGFFSNTFGKLKDLFLLFGEYLKGFFTPIINLWKKILSPIADFFAQMFDKIGKAWSKGGDSIVKAWNSVIEFFKETWNVLKSIFSVVFDFILLPFEMAFEIIKGIANGIWIVVKGIVNAIISYFKLLGNTIYSILEHLGIIDFFKTVFEGIKTMWIAIVGFFNTIWNSIKTIFSTVATWFGGVFQNAANVVKNIWNSVVGFFQTVWNAIKIVFGVVALFFATIFRNAVNNIKTVFNAVIAFFKSVWNAIKNVFSVAGSWFSTIFRNAVNNIKTVFSVIGSFFSGVWNRIKSIFSPVVNFFGGIFKSAYSKIKAFFNPIVSFFSGVWNKIKGIFSKVGTTISTAIVGSVKGAINTVLRGATSIINGFINAINAAIGTINEIPGVNISKIGTLSAPQLARGGILRRGQVGLLEGDGSEAVIPLDQNKKWISALSKSILKNTNGSGFGGIGSNDNIGNDIVFNQTINSPKPLSRYEIYKDTKKQINLMRMVMQNG